MLNNWACSESIIFILYLLLLVYFPKKNLFFCVAKSNLIVNDLFVFICESFITTLLEIYREKEKINKSSMKLMIRKIDLSSIYLSLSLIACVDKSRWILLCYDKSFTDYFSFFLFWDWDGSMDIFFVIFISRFCRFIFSLFYVCKWNKKTIFRNFTILFDKFW